MRRLVSSFLARLLGVWRWANQLGRQPAPLLALLTLLGSFAFQARVGGSLSLPAPAPAAHAHAHHQAPQPDPPAAHDHGAHCPFCLTQAFGEVPDVALLPPAPAAFQPPALPVWLSPHLAAPRTAEARAPPQRAAPTRAAFVRPPSC